MADTCPSPRGWRRCEVAAFQTRRSVVRSGLASVMDWPSARVRGRRAVGGAGHYRTRRERERVSHIDTRPGMDSPSAAPWRAPMKSQRPLTEQSHRDAGDGVERTVTQARGGVRRGMTKILVISTLLAVGAVSAVWLVSARTAPGAQQSLGTRTAALVSAPQRSPLKSKVWDQANLGADGLEKCSAFRQVLSHATELQGAGRGPISQSERTQLEAELNTAKTMPPVSLTPFQCGVPLG